VDESKPDWERLVAEEGNSSRLVDKLRVCFESLDSYDHAPFQFVLPILGALYYDLTAVHFKAYKEQLPGTSRLRNEDAEEMSEAEQKRLTKYCSSCENLEKWASGQGLEQILQIHVPPKGFAKQSGLIALACFSWENTRRIFIARRFFPYYYDILSYSHCAPGWGALGELLKWWEEEERQPGEYFPIEGNKLPVNKLLPYIAERRRLGHEAVVALPILRTGQLIGCFCLFLKNTQCLPQNSTKLKNWWSKQCNSLVQILDRHNNLLKRGDNGGDKGTDLATEWRKLNSKDALIAELTLTDVNKGRNALRVAEKIVGSVSYDYYGIVDEKKLPGKIVVLIGTYIDSTKQREVEREIIALCARIIACENTDVSLTFAFLNDPGGCIARLGPRTCARAPTEND